MSKDDIRTFEVPDMTHEDLKAHITELTFIVIEMTTTPRELKSSMNIRYDLLNLVQQAGATESILDIRDHAR